MALVKRLAEAAGMTEDEAASVLNGAERRYKVFAILKRGGGRRIIAQPSGDLKRLQRAFLQLFPLPAHDAVMSYRASIGIRENAARHAGCAFLLKTDFQRFFPSIKPEFFWREVERFSKEAWAAELLAERPLVEQLLFWRPARRLDGKRVLSIGAPSSPMVSNFCLYFFDETMAQFCSACGVTYTRYADDLTFSTQEAGRLGQVLAKLKGLLRTQWPYLVLNGAKTVFASRRTNRHVTGIVINNEGALSLGREKKRRLKALVHQAISGRLDEEAASSLVGWLHFAAYADPDFMTALNKKYTLKRMAALRRGEVA